MNLSQSKYALSVLCSYLSVQGQFLLMRRLSRTFDAAVRENTLHSRVLLATGVDKMNARLLVVESDFGSDKVEEILESRVNLHQKWQTCSLTVDPGYF